jgi:hypothetical protein
LFKKKKILALYRNRTPVIPALSRQRQENDEFKVSLAYS